MVDNEPNRLFTNKDIIPAMRSSGIPLAFSPGSSWRYCNMGYALLAMLVEKTSKQTFGNYLETYIFKPANMRHSYLLKTKTGLNQVTGYLIRTHYLNDMESIDSSRKVRPWSYHMSGFEGPTNVISTTTYDSYAAALLAAGKKEAAILMYQKSIAMNPGNEPAKKTLKKIQSER